LGDNIYHGEKMGDYCRQASIAVAQGGANVFAAVDKAESEPDLAMAVNGVAPGVIGAAAAELGVPVLHLSTDYVFDGSSARPCRPEDPVAPLGVYGASKLAGEQALAASGATYAIIRTAWIYSPFGANFVKTMLRLAETRDELGVVADQIGCPTSALDIADMLLTIVARWQREPGLGANRVYHFAGRGEASWADMARQVFAVSAKLGGPNARVNDITTEQYPTPARRPANSRLDCADLEHAFDFALRDWHDSLEIVVRRLLNSEA
jgi:dTDP-4-dehydrorhamnose reductase